MRHLIGGILDNTDAVTVVDMEAGLEHLSRGTGRHVDTLLVVMEPYYKALETARRSAELGRELGIARVVGVANKIRDEADQVAVREYAAAHQLTLAAEVPFDDAVRHADQKGRPLIDEPSSPAVDAIASLMTVLGLDRA